MAAAGGCGCASGASGGCGCAHVAVQEGAKVCVCSCAGCQCNSQVAPALTAKWRAGWEPSVELRVDGMTCGSCAATVHRALLADARVAAVMVHVHDKRVLIQTAPGEEKKKEKGRRKGRRKKKRGQ